MKQITPKFYMSTGIIYFVLAFFHVISYFGFNFADSTEVIFLIYSAIFLIYGLFVAFSYKRYEQVYNAERGFAKPIHRYVGADYEKIKATEGIAKKYSKRKSPTEITFIVISVLAMSLFVFSILTHIFLVVLQGFSKMGK